MKPSAQRAAQQKAGQMRSAYARMARTYDHVFGPLLNRARLAAVEAVNALPGTQVLEAGVGTGLALPRYRPEKRITGIDLSGEMLRQAEARAGGLANVEALLRMDAQVMSFPDHGFDIAAAMFLASVVPDARALLAELRRVVRPGGRIVIVNHFAAEQGMLRYLEQGITPICLKLGWRSDFRLDEMLDPASLREARQTALPPLGLFRLVELTN